MSDRVVVFLLAGQRLALPRQAVRECLALPRLHALPGQPPAVAGFFVLGGKTWPALDLACLLDLRGADAPEADGLYRHLVRLDQAALLVDRVLDVAVPDPSPPEPEDGGWQNACIAARLRVGGEPVALLSPGRLLAEWERARLALLSAQAGTRRRAWDGDAA